MTLPKEIVDLESVTAHPNILVFSKPKAGKTTWACSDDNTLLINCEVEGEISAANSNTLGHNVKQWKVRKYEDFKAAKTWLQEYSWCSCYFIVQQNTESTGCSTFVKKMCDMHWCITFEKYKS